MTARGYFVTGTDTGVGKTLIAAALVRRFRGRGLRVAGMKPVASGSLETAGGLVNEDALILQREGSKRWPYATVNPLTYRPAIAPHVAAAAAGRPIDFDLIAGRFAELASDSDLVVVEGAGGWRVPLHGRRTIASLAAHLGLPVVLVVGMRLGCLNHAFLTAEAIERDGLRLAGWVANGIDPAFECRDENFATLQDWLPAPCLGEVPALSPPDVRTAAERLDPTPLLERTLC